MEAATATKAAYLLDHDWEQESRRLELLEQHADPTTVRRLEATGITAGWRCAEVGAGRGSIARWMSQTVGSTGSVLALDLETSLLEHLDEPNIDVVGGDVLDYELPAGSLDLIHTRLVLMHIPERERAIERMISWLRPGGWLVVEELDWMALLSDPDPDRISVFRAFDQALPSIDFECGRALVHELADAGLADCAADLRVDMVHGGTQIARWEQLSITALADHVLSAGTATEDQLAKQLAKLDDPTYRGLGWAWVGASGRRAS